MCCCRVPYRCMCVCVVHNGGCRTACVYRCADGCVYVGYILSVWVAYCCPDGICLIRVVALYCIVYIVFTLAIARTVALCIPHTVDIYIYMYIYINILMKIHCSFNQNTTPSIPDIRRSWQCGIRQRVHIQSNAAIRVPFLKGHRPEHHKNPPYLTP